MVDTLIPYDTELRKIKQDLPNILRKILKDNEDEVIRILQNFQLSKGLDSKGKLTGRYTAATEQISESKPVPPRQPKVAGAPFNYQDTGSLFDNMYMFFEDMKSYSLFSRDSKAEYLQDTYGDIFTLSQQNNERINNEILLPNAWEEIIRRFGNI